MIRTILKKFKKWIFIYLVLGILLNLSNCLIVVIFQKFIDSCQNIAQIEKIIIYIVVFGILLLIANILGYLQNYPETYLENAITEQIKLLALEKISRIEYEQYQKNGTGKIVQLIENGSSAGTSIIFSFFLRIFSDLLPSIFFSLFFIGSMNISVMIALAIGYIFVFIISQLLMKKLYEYKERLLHSQEQKSKYSIRSFMELVVFRINKQYRSEIEKIENIAQDVINNECKIIMTHEAFFSLFELLVTIIKILILLLGIRNLISGNTTIGILVALISLVDKVYNPIAIFNVLFIQYKLNRYTYNRLIDFISENDDKNLYVGQPVQEIRQSIEIKNLSYSYNDKPCFSGLNMEICKGLTVALVGESGGGKSTLVKLLCGLLKKQDGQILINGEDIDSLELNSYYDHISYLSQETSVFDGTIRENIVFQDNIDDNVIYGYLREVNLYEKVQSLENQLDTAVGERGIQLSGGERQRLALARVLAQKKEIVILDEATSALDIINEQIVINNIIRSKQGCTIIIIAHRIQSIKNADSIIVFKNFKIDSVGTFNELLQHSSYFRELWNKGMDQNF